MLGKTRKLEEAPDKSKGAIRKNRTGEEIAKEVTFS